MNFLSNYVAEVICIAQKNVSEMGYIDSQVGKVPSTKYTYPSS